MEVVGRKDIITRIKKRLKSDKAELMAILGRRRVGKTFLISRVLKEDIVFQFTGLYQSNLKEHLERFSVNLSKSMKASIPVKTPESWFEAFDMLGEYISGLRTRKKKVVFLDEFPWMATNRSRLLTAFTDFWNGFAVQRNDLMVVICGSSASWMINKVLKSRGGLHNRVTDRILLQPFTLSETKQFLRKKNIIINDMDITRLYMMMGGIPFYLEQLEKGESLVQSIDRVCFAKNALLRLEYDELLASLFDHSAKHTAIIETLHRQPGGLMRDELLMKTKLQSGGGFTSILEELEASDFITSAVPYGNKAKDRIFKLKDYYINFYLKYIRGSKPGKTRIWEKLATSPSYISWSGLAFENVCIDHIDEIKRALKIDGIYSTSGAWHTRGDDEVPGAQIDLLIDRADNIINICEIKFTNSPYIITSDYAQKIRLKLGAFNHFTKSRKTLFPTMITTYGLVDNKHSNSLIQQSITMSDLF
ncbi:MAG: AAA family ATPase [Saprospiraceae bacterium]|nr:AAA family ATPase [Saprospiraceae bacterium]